MQDYVSIMSLPLYFVLRMSSCALVFLVYNKWSLECFCDLPQSASISPKTLQDPSETIVKMKVNFENHHRKCICYSSFISLTSRITC